MKKFKYLLYTLIFFVGMAFALVNPEPTSPTAKFIYKSKNCRYDVYRSQAGGTIQCNDWSFVGTVTSGNSVSVTLNPGDNIVVRVVKDGAGVCDGSKQKRQDHLSFKSNATRSSSTSWELHDWSCD